MMERREIRVRLARLVILVVWDKQGLRELLVGKVRREQRELPELQDRP